MARSYAVCGSATTQNSATVPQAQIVATSAVRPKIYDLIVGSSSTPADNVGQFKVQRNSTASTGGTAITPAPIDPGDPASLSAAMMAPSMTAPTLGTVLLQWAQNQRATFRWVAAPGKELVAPATASNGLTLMNPTRNADWTVDVSIEFEE